MSRAPEGMEAHTYVGHFRSAIARAKRALLKAGIPWSVTTGRYTPFDSQQVTTYGVRVWRVGCSTNISASVHGGSHKPREEIHALAAKARDVLRAAGLPFDDRGWLHCTYGD